MSTFVGMLSAWLMLILGLIFRWTEQYMIADTFHLGGLVIMFLVLAVVLNEHTAFLRKLNHDLKRIKDANHGK